MLLRVSIWVIIQFKKKKLLAWVTQPALEAVAIDYRTRFPAAQELTAIAKQFKPHAWEPLLTWQCPRMRGRYQLKPGYEIPWLKLMHLLWSRLSQVIHTSWGAGTSFCIPLAVCNRSYKEVKRRRCPWSRHAPTQARPAQKPQSSHLRVSKPYPKHSFTLSWKGQAQRSQNTFFFFFWMRANYSQLPHMALDPPATCQSSQGKSSIWPMPCSFPGVALHFPYNH